MPNGGVHRPTKANFAYAGFAVSETRRIVTHLSFGLGGKPSLACASINGEDAPKTVIRFTVDRSMPSAAEATAARKRGVFYLNEVPGKIFTPS
jgi:hypothetical protein